MADRFVKVMNTHISGNGYHLTPRELYVLSYLKYQSEGRQSFRFRMADFIDFVNSKGDSFVKYSGDRKESKVLKLKDKRSLAPILNSLVELGLIETECGEDFTSVNVNKLIQIKLIDRKCDGTEFEAVKYELIEDLFAKLGYNGFSLFCFLKKNHVVPEKGFGGSCSYPLEFIANYTGLDTKTVTAYTKLLEDYKLIKFTSAQKDNQIEFAKAEEEGREPVFKKNYYDVICKYDNRDKYFITFSSSTSQQNMGQE